MSYHALAPDVGFIGLGQMGYRMAQNLLKNGKSLIAFDVASEPVNNLVKEGAVAAANPQEVSKLLVTTHQ